MEDGVVRGCGPADVADLGLASAAVRVPRVSGVSGIFGVFGGRNCLCVALGEGREDFAQFRDDLGEGGSGLWILVPAADHEVDVRLIGGEHATLDGPLPVSALGGDARRGVWHGRASSLVPYDENHLERAHAVVRELPGDHLPHDEAEGVDISWFGEERVAYDLWRVPSGVVGHHGRGDTGLGDVGQPAEVEVRHLDVPVSVDEQVRRLQIPVDDCGLVRVQVQHALGGVEHHADAAVPAESAGKAARRPLLGLHQHVIERSTGAVLGDHARRIGAHA
mmetsp:Transcript_12877/g.36912  ORF Transcript_12877/g.36912 Transcript_12877/m.36912 type:complete len:278 (+) Transcript_12877:1912-2745(+)